MATGNNNTDLKITLSNKTDGETTQNLNDSAVVQPVAGGTVSQTGADLDIGGVANSVDVTVTQDDQGATEVALNSAWNSLKNVRVDDDGAADITTTNFVHADIALGDGGDSTVNVVDAKRGNITTGDGNDAVKIDALSNGSGWSNLFTVDTGEGNDTVTFNGDRSYTKGDLDLGADQDVLYINADNVVADGGDGIDIVVIGKDVDASTLDLTNFEHVVQEGEEMPVLAPEAAPEEAAENLLVNGDFEIHGNLNKGSWGTFASIEGWYAEDTNTDTAGVADIEIQNKRHGGVPVYAEDWAADNSFVELDSHGNGGETHVKISQDITLENDGVYELSFDHASRSGQQNENGIQVLVDGVVVYEVEKLDNEWTNKIISLDLTAGAHKISFQGTGAEDTYGTLIDNASLVRTGDLPVLDPVTINKDNVDSTDLGFRVLGQQVIDGERGDALAENVSTHSQGFGVQGSASGPSEQLGFHIGSQTSEGIVVEFDTFVSGAQVEIARLFLNEGSGGEQGKWQAFKDGALVAEGDFVAASGHEVDFDISVGGGFDTLLFTALDYVDGPNGKNDASDYLIGSISFTPGRTPVNGNVIPAPVDDTPVDDTPVDDTPVDDTPVDDTPVDDAPVDDAPVDDTPVDDAPVDDTPVDDSPADPSDITAGNILLARVDARDSDNHELFVAGETGTVRAHVIFEDKDGSETPSIVVSIPTGVTVTDQIGAYTPGSDGTGGTLDLSSLVQNGELDQTIAIKLSDSSTANEILRFDMAVSTTETTSGATTSAARFDEIEINLPTPVAATVAPRVDFDGDGKANALFQKTANDYVYSTEDSSVGTGHGVQAGREVLAIADFNDDGESDILWQQADNDYTFIAFSGDMSTTQGLGTRGGQTLLAVADFDGDGKDDILWKIDANDFFVVNPGGDASQAYGVGQQPNKEVLGIADTQGDGGSDIILRDTTTGFAVIIDDADANSPRGLGGQTGRELLGTGDFNGDGTEDLLWQKTDNGFTYFFASGDTTRQSNMGSRTDQELKAIADFNGDGADDTLWQRSSDGYLFIDSGSDLSQRTGLGMQGGKEVLGVGDFNGNGSMDIVLRDTGNGYTFIINDGDATSQTGLGAQATRELLAIDDFNGNGSDDLLFRDVNTHQAFIAFDGDITNQQSLGVFENVDHLSDLDLLGLDMGTADGVTVIG